MQIGLLTDSLSTMTRSQALDTAAELGIETVEIGLGGLVARPARRPGRVARRRRGARRRCSETSPPAAYG